MPEYRRAFMPGGTYFFTVNTYQRQPILAEVDVRMALRQGIARARQTLPFQVDAWVLLPDHLHCIWTLPPGDGNFSARWAIIKRQVSRYRGEHGEYTSNPSRQKRGESGLWQRRFWEHLIRDESDFERHMDYIHWNPVKHGYVQRVADWPYSTFHRYVRDGIYSPDWSAEEFDEEACAFGEFQEKGA